LKTKRYEFMIVLLKMYSGTHLVS